MKIKTNHSEQIPSGRVAEGRQGANQATHHVSCVADAIVSAPGLDLALLGKFDHTRTLGKSSPYMAQQFMLANYYNRPKWQWKMDHLSMIFLLKPQFLVNIHLPRLIIGGYIRR